MKNGHEMLAELINKGISDWQKHINAEIVRQFKEKFGFSPVIDGTMIIKDEAKPILARHEIHLINDRWIETGYSILHCVDAVVLKEREHGK